MIDLHTWSTPNGFKPLIMLEETGLPYRLRPVDLRAGAQKAPEFLRLNPNGKIPVLVDDEAEGGPIVLFESGAILIYLADKSGQLLAADPRRRFEVVQWLMFQMSAIGPVFGQLGAFSRADPPNPAAVDKFRGEGERLLAVLEGQLERQAWLGDDYSIADISTFTWVRATDFVGLRPGPVVSAWKDRIAARPAVRRALAAFDASPPAQG